MSRNDREARPSKTRGFSDRQLADIAARALRLHPTILKADLLPSPPSTAGIATSSSSSVQIDDEPVRTPETLSPFPSPTRSQPKRSSMTPASYTDGSTPATPIRSTASAAFASSAPHASPSPSASSRMTRIQNHPARIFSSPSRTPSSSAFSSARHGHLHVPTDANANTELDLRLAHVQHDRSEHLNTLLRSLVRIGIILLALLGAVLLPSFERVVAIHGGGFGMVLVFVLPIWAAIRLLGPGEGRRVDAGEEMLGRGVTKVGRVSKRVVWWWYFALGVSVLGTIGGLWGGLAGAGGGLGGK